MISQAPSRPYTMDAGSAWPVIATLEVGHLQPDLRTLDRLARVALLARRRGGCVQLCGVSEELRELIELAGLSEVLLPDHCD
jgi:hypothetical protein